MNKFKAIKLIVFCSIIIGVMSKTSYTKTEDNCEDIVSQLLKAPMAKLQDAKKHVISSGVKCIPVLSKSYNGANGHGKFEILDVLGEIKDENSVNATLTILKKQSERAYSGGTWGGEPVEEFHNRKAAFVLRNIGKIALPILKKEIKKSEGEFKKRLIITTGFLADKTYYDLISNILKEDTNPFIRRLAAFALGNIGDKKAVSLLEKALKDEFYYELKADKYHDIILPPPHNRVYPVREAAVHSLIDLGVKIKRERWDIWIEKGEYEEKK